MDFSSLYGPLFAVVVLATVLWKVAPMAPQAFRRWRSGSWPWARTTIQGGSVKVITQSEGKSVYQLTAGYTYSVEGREYSGTYMEIFQTDEEAQGILKSLQELPPPARYKKGNPAESVMDPYRDAALAVISRQ